ncbi:putative DNA replication complex GINS protein PSF3 [Tetrabaena socialis]|uniref:Putative DNA replication complex GINS protein PSF3 n=1 Tax=Tetrabaena socialis TaxID=47790 RepID=A0A2J7ZM66_9CHLO|nr:putative DNA replication complex GINS protein PSF3 [Tetrabaena socialis]|eukprot:PNH01340.1 putative DNA replication complex GINS protein PSF3 [Tetrabaena socialis]
MTDYWSLDGALAEETIVPARFKFGVHGVARVLEPGSTSNDVEPEAKVDAPLWLAAALGRRSMVTISLPETYHERYRRRLNAGAECINLKGRAPYFYDVGNKCNEFLQDLTLSAFLARTYATRYRELVSRGLSTVSGEDMLELQSKLSLEELAVFEAGRESVARAELWARGARPRATVAVLPTRKRAAATRDGAEVAGAARQKA